MQIPTNNYERAVQVYEDGGVSAVFQAVADGFIHSDGTHHCVPCEMQTPHEGHTCLVCGTHNPKQPQVLATPLEHKIRFERATDCYQWLAENDIHLPVTLTLHLGE
jgi:hypothetical protein